MLSAYTKKNRNCIRLLLYLVTTFISINTAYCVDLSQEPIQPIPLTLHLDPAKVALGKKLFEDPFIAHDKNQSCFQCHQTTQNGTDNLYRSTTNAGEYDLINTPTIFNVAFNVRHTWSGEFKTLEAEVNGGLHNPRHANTTWDELLPKLESRSDYQKLFSAIYGKKFIDKHMVQETVASYEKSLITPNAPFDKYLRGDKNAISLQAKKGYQLFKNYGCIACHQGVNVGGNMFQKMGVFGDYFAHRGNITKTDYGRFNVTGLEKDRFVFRVPSLRNVAVTAPYFHDGKTKSLDAAIDVMATHQLGRKISTANKAALIAFLNSLTGEYQGKSLSLQEK